MKSLLAGGAIIAASVIGVGTAASAQAPLYPPQPPIVNINITLNLSVTVIIINGDFNLTFIGCQVGENVQIAFNGGTSIVGCVGSGGGASRLMAPAAGGVATASLTAPSTPGVYPVTATGLTSGFSATKLLTVVGTPAEVVNPVVNPVVQTPAATPAAAAGASTASAALPATGNDSNQTLLIAGSTLLAGLGLAGVGLRRRQHAAAS